MDVIVELFGGPLDGVTMTSDSTDPIERNKVEWIAKVVGGCMRDAEKREVAFHPGAIYSVPSEETRERAMKEGWSEAKIAALMPRHQYEFWRVQEKDGLAHILLRFKYTS